jgi:hypothetical protein
VVVEVGCGVTVYPAREAGDRWRAVWYENGRRRQCEAVTEARLTAKLDKVATRLTTDAPGLGITRHRADHLLPVPGPAPGREGWSRKHTDTQRRLCTWYLAPVITRLACEDITTGHMQQVVNTAPTAKEGARVARCISALVSAGITGG